MISITFALLAIWAIYFAANHNIRLITAVFVWISIIFVGVAIGAVHTPQALQVSTPADVFKQYRNRK